MLNAILNPMPRKLNGARHVMHVFCDSAEVAAVEVGKTAVLDVRRVADAHGFFYALGARLVWRTPLAFVARQLHRIPRIRGEVLFTEQPYRNPISRFVVTRTVA